MILYVSKYNTASLLFERVAVIDDATSIIWIKRYQGAGEFELYMRATPERLELFSSGEIMLTKDGDNGGMLVETVKLTTSFEEGDYITVTGRSLESILGRRIIASQLNLRMTAELAMRQIVISVFIGGGPARAIPNFGLTLVKNYTETIDRQFTGKNILETLSDIAHEVGYGFKLTRSGNFFLFDIFKPVDRSTRQTERPFVIFSPSFENLGNSEYERNAAEKSNAVYVAGQGQGSERIIVSAATTEAIGLLRREKWVDSRNTSSTTEEGEMTDAEYKAKLRAQGNEELSLSDILTTFSGEIINTNGYVYGVDYELGDIVSVENEYGIKGIAHVAEITEVEDETGYRMYPTLSEWQEYEIEEE